MTALSVRTALRAAGVPDAPLRLLRTLALACPVRLRPVLENMVSGPPTDLPPGTLALTVHVRELRRAVVERLSGGLGPHEVLVWSREDSELLVIPASLQLRATAGFLVATLEVEAAELRRTPVRLVFFLGTPRSGAGKAASVTHDGETPALLVDAWGEALRTAVWEGVLDVIEGAAIEASRVAGVPLRVLGFTGGEDRVLIAVGP